MSSVLKRAIGTSDKILSELATKAGIGYRLMHRFLAGEADLSMKALDAAVPGARPGVAAKEFSLNV